MTDGDDEERRKYGTETFNKIIENNWNNYSINDDVYGFYVMLNPALEDRSETTQDRKRGAEIRARRNLINDTEYFWYVNSANININIIKLQNNLVYNIRNEKNINIGYKGDLQGLSFELIAPSNAPFEIKEVKQNGDKLNVSISRKDNIDIHTLLESKEYTIKVKMNGADEFTRLVSPNLTLNCISQKENNLTVTHTQAAKSQSFSTWDNIKSKLGFDIDKSASFGTVHYHPKFLWSPENTTPVIDSIYFNFSQDAKLNGSTYAEFQFVDNNGHPYNDETLIIFDGDEVLNNNTIKITSADYAKELKFIFSPEAESGKHQGYFRLISHGQLHRIDHYFLDHLESKTLTANKQDPNNQVNVFQWTLHFKKHINPLLLLIIWIFILLCFLVFLTWLTFKLHRCFAAKFPKNWAIRFRNDENNIVLEPARVGKYFYKNRGTLLDGKSATIHTHILSKEHIKEIIISRNSQNNFHHPWYGDTIYISCDFKNYDIDYIKILPRRRCIHMSVYYTNQFIESPQEIILKVDNNKFESNKQNITDGLTVFAFIPVVKNINNSLNN